MKNKTPFILVALLLFWVVISSYNTNSKNFSLDNLLAKIFSEAKSADLVKLSGSQVLLNKEAVAAFERMRVAAKLEGILLKPRSGFRSISYQRRLMNLFTQNYGKNYAQKVLKEPGESEHHTGYAIDIDDANNLACSLKPCFEQTAAYQWLTKHASSYGFELSYPRGNSEGIAFEPWHWRFIGSEESRKVLK